MKKILLQFDEGAVPERYLREIRIAAQGYEVIVTNDEKKIGMVLEDITAVACWRPSDQVLDAAGLRWIQVWSAGVDWVVGRKDLHDRQLVITNTAGIHGIPISEHIFSLIFAFSKNLHSSIRAQGRREWISHSRDAVYEVAGTTMVLLGLGGIGQRTAEVATAVGMEVIGIRRDTAKRVSGVAEIRRPDELLEVLPKGDWVVSTLPGTPETTGMIGEREFRAMKKTAVFVNVGRGKSVDERAMIRALDEKWIRGAGLDVFEKEPLPKESPLWDMDNVIITPHHSGMPAYYAGRPWELYLENLARFVRGEELMNVVDIEAGY